MSESPEEEIIHRQIDTNTDDPAVALAEEVAEIENTDPTTLPTMYQCIDGILDNLFAKPPAPEAQLRVEFSYDRYRITVEQDGSATFMKTE